MHASIYDEMTTGLRFTRWSAAFVALFLATGTTPVAAQEAGAETSEEEGEASAEVQVNAEVAPTESQEAEGEAEAVAEELEEEPAESPQPYVEDATSSVPEEPEVVVAPPPASPPWGLDVGGILFRPGVEVWTRAELRGNSYVLNPGGWDAVGNLYSRTRVQLDAKWEMLRGFIQIQDARQVGITEFALNAEPAGPTTGVHQGFLEIGDTGTWVRVGRQEINYGGQRMLGALNWTLVARAFDAIRGHAMVGLGDMGQLHFDLHGAMRSVPGTQITDAMMNSTRTEGDFIGGGFAEWQHSPALTLGGYVYFRHDGPTSANLANDANLATFSLRGSGTVDGVLRYEAEAFIQAGGTNAGDHLAAAAIGEVNYKLKDVAWTPEFGIGGTFATGNSPNGDWQAFNDHFPTNHLIYGLADLFGLRNQTHGYLRFQLTPDPGRFTFFGYGRLFRWMEPTDSWTNLARATISATPAGDDFAGGELDIDFRWNPIDHFGVWFGYSVFIPAQGALDRRMSDEEMHFAYAMLQLDL